MIRVENFDNIIVGNLNINFISPKFDEFKLMVSSYFNAILVTETKLDDSFPKAQFCIDGFYIPYRLDRNRNEGDLMIYVRDNTPSKMLTKHNLSEDIEATFIELSFRKSSGYCAQHIAHPPKIIITFLIILINVSMCILLMKVLTYLHI